ncbi:UNVERIFIED_CONTAM: hypothetical protein RMT77_013558 [Armadillidium vulgare]
MNKLIVIGVGVCFLVIVIVVAVLMSVQDEGEESLEKDYSGHYFSSCDNASTSSELGTFPSAGVSTDAVPCGSIATDILKRNGTAADAAVAAMFCVGVINAQSSGLGGGFVATYYSKGEGKMYSLDAREVAPKAATSHMYNPDFNPNLRVKTGKWYEDSPPNMRGGLAVGVPGESAGLYELYTRFGGGVPWADLLEPTIKICEEGYKLTWYTGGILYPMRMTILAEPSMSIFTNVSENRILHEGETVYRHQLAKTLRVLQKEPYALYNGSLVNEFVEDLEEFGGIITVEDMKDYRPIWREPVSIHLENGNYTLYSFPPPGSGFIFGLIMNILDEFNLTKSSLEGDELFRTNHITAEAFKFAYAQRFRLGDISDAEREMIATNLTSNEFANMIMNLIDEDQTISDPLYYGTEIVPGADDGTAHLSLISPKGDAIAITSSINAAMGAVIRSNSTGIIYNNEMGDFTTDIQLEKKGSMFMSKNKIIPGHRPLSSMCPSIILDEFGNTKLVIGAAGGVKIPSAAAWVASRFLWMGQDLKSAIDECRTHHSLLPMELRFEKGFPKEILDSLRKKGHVMKEYTWKSVSNAVARDRDGRVVANFDLRKSGQIDGF